MSFFSSQWNTVKPKPGVMIDPLHPLSKGLVGFWLFNEGSGSKCYDISGCGNHGTLKNMSTNSEDSGWCSSNFGGGLCFDGTDDYVDLGDTNDFDNPNTTVSAWVKSTSSAADMRIVVSGSEYTNQWHLIMHQGHIVMTRSTESFDYFDTVDTFNDGVWHHIVGIRSPIKENIKVYVDSVEQTDGGVATAYSLDGNPKIGAKNSTSYFFDGSIDFICIYNRALSAEEVKMLYHDPFCNLLRIPIRYVPAVPEAGQPMMKRWGGIPFMKGQRFGAKVW